MGNFQNTGKFKNVTFALDLSRTDGLYLLNRDVSCQPWNLLSSRLPHPQNDTVDAHVIIKMTQIRGKRQEVVTVSK